MQQPRSNTGDHLSPRHAMWTVAAASAAAFVFAAAISAQTYLSMRGHGHNLTGIFLWQFSCWVMWALASPFVLTLGAALSAARARQRHLPIAIAATGVVGTCVHMAVCAWLSVTLRPYEPEVFTSFGEAFVAQIESLLPLDVVTFALLIFLGWALAVSRRARQLEVRESRLETELARAKLEALRLEIQPHFLFNTLNAISALIRSGANDRALTMLLKLGDLMRQTLDRHQEPMVTLDAEVAFTRQYVELQQLRFGDRLHVHFQVPASCGSCLVPTLLLQPLVENALRHGLGKVSRACTVAITAQLDGDRLVVSVSDDGAGLPPAFSLDRDGRTGLGNTLSRLKRLFGSLGALTLTPQPNGGTVASVILPVRRHAAADVA